MYTWTVWKGCRRVGIIESASQFQAYWEAQRKYGKNVMIERAAVGLYQPKNEDRRFGDSQRI